MIEKLIENTKLNANTQFANTELNSDDQQALKNYVDYMPFSLSNKQMEYVKSDEDDVDLYQNPLKDLIIECGNLVNNVKNNVMIYMTPQSLNINITSYSANVKFTTLSNTCNLASNVISDFYSHTNRLSGLEKANANYPDLESALSVGRELTPFIHKSSSVKAVKYKDQYYVGNPSESYDDIIEQNLPMFIETDSGDVIEMGDSPDLEKGYVTNINYPANNFISEDTANVSNLPILGNFGSLYINDDGSIDIIKGQISDNLNNLFINVQTDKTKITNANPNTVMIVLNTATSNTTLQNTVIHLTDGIKNLSNTLNAQINSDCTFFNNSKKLLKKINTVTKLSNMSASHEILYDKIGTSNGKILMTKLK